MGTWVLQHYSQGVWSFLPFSSLAALLQHARASYGLTEMQFLEYALLRAWGTDNDPFTLQWWEGEIPDMSMSLSATTLKGGQDVGARFRAQFAKKS